MDVILERFAYTNLGTFGRWWMPGVPEFYTVERPWVPYLDDARYPSGAPFKSCIPEGVYDLIPRKRPKRGNTYAIVNEDLGVYEFKHDDRTRYGILVHVGNSMRDVVGCIAPGDEFAPCEWLNPPIPGVLNSDDSMKKIASRLGRSETHRLFIRQYRPFKEVA